MIDIHTHILPCVDDGSDSIQTSIAMIQQAKEQGITHIILTPHAILNTSYYVEKEELKKLFLKFLQDIGPTDIEFFLGSEIYYTDKSYQKLLKGELVTLNDSKYILIEFPMHERCDIEESLYNISVKGFIPILAHPERYKYLTMDDVRAIKEYALVQVNTSSILGDHGKAIKKFALDLIKHDLVDFISSDCHNPLTRKVNLLETHKFVSKKYGSSYADKVFVENQEGLIKEIKNKL